MGHADRIKLLKQTCVLFQAHCFEFGPVIGTPSPWVYVGCSDLSLSMSWTFKKKTFGKTSGR